VVPIFICCLGLSFDHPLWKRALYHSVLVNLHARGYFHFNDAELSEKGSGPMLFGKLQHHNVRIVIILDELDELDSMMPYSKIPGLCDFESTSF